MVILRLILRHRLRFLEARDIKALAAFNHYDESSQQNVTDNTRKMRSRCFAKRVRLNVILNEVLILNPRSIKNVSKMFF